MKDDVIRRHGVSTWLDNMGHPELADAVMDENRFPSAQPERLTDDDFETIRIHLSAFKESLCNQRRWGEAKDYERLIDRFMSFASERPEITEEQVREYCRKRCMSVIDNALLAKYINGCQDTISRRAAIDAVHKNYDVILDFTSDGQTISSSIEDILSELPSAQPEVAKDTNVLTNDCISRQAVIDALNKLDVSDGVGISSVACDLQEEAIRSIENLLSAQPERMRGEWIEDDDGWDGVIWRCSECDAVFTLVDGTPKENEYYFCPHCGADMRENDHE